jgi:two-component sensor histidine kinase
MTGTRNGGPDSRPMTALPLAGPERWTLVAIHEREEVLDEDPRAELAAILTHQLRNRLSRLVFALEQLSKSEGENAATAARLRRGVAEIVSWLGQLVATVQTMTGRFAITTDRIDLRRPIRAALGSFEPVFAVRNQTLEVDLPPDEILADADAEAIRLVCVSLLSNAAAFTPPGGPITISLTADETSATLRVADRGAGIAAEDLPHVFRSFHRRSESAPRAGVGAGLALVRTAVELHGGTVRAESAGPQRGSVFTIVLPRTRADARKLERVLIACDDEGASAMLAVLARAWGYGVEVLAAQERIFEVAASYQPSVIVVGRSFAAFEPAIRAAVAPKDVAVVLAGERPDPAASDAEFDAILAEPIDPDAFHAVLIDHAPITT